MKTNLFALCILALFTTNILKAQFPASNFTLVGNINPETGVNGFGDKYSGCWGWYQSSLNKEYAIACSKSGTYFVDVTAPATPTVCDFEPGVSSNGTWREVKTYQNYCYVICDDNPSTGFQIFDMSNLPANVTKVYESNALFKKGHACWVDGNKLYVSGVTYSTGVTSSLNVYSLANPAAPVLLRQLKQDASFITYVHDAFVRNDTVYASCGNQGLYVFKFNTGTNTFTQLGSLTSYPGSGYNHSSALTPNGQNLVFTDEVPSGLPVKVADVTNLSNISVLATTNQFTATTPHNPFMVSNQYCFMSSYQEGLQLYDISNPSTPFLAGFFDTFFQGGGNTGNYGGDAYQGQWGAYPFLPSKNIFALDMSNGIFMLKTHLYMNPPAVNFSAPTFVCAGNPVTFTNTTSGATSYTWTFPGGTPATSTATNPIITYNLPGSYSVILKAANQGGSTTINQSISVTQVNATTTFTNASCVSCATGAAAVSPTGGNIPYSYAWLPSGGSSNIASNLLPGCYTVNISDANSCVASKTVCVSFSTGLKNVNLNDGSVSIYPNPAKNNFTIRVEENATFNLTVYNLLGEETIRVKNLTSQFNINCGEFKKGLYLVSVETGGQRILKKVVVQ
jgi:choice-of-anchor B domain-containing protein